MKLHITCLLVPNVQALIVRATHASLKGSTLAAFERFVAKQEIESKEVAWFGGSGAKPAGYYYPNGSVIMVMGVDQPGKALSMSLDRVLIDEASQVSVVAYETLLTRLRGSADTFRQAVCCTNPDNPDHWLKRRADDPDTPLKMYTSLHQDNPYLFTRDGKATEAGTDYLGFLNNLTGLRRARYLEGRWVGAEGLVFDDWREDVNVVDELPDMSGWRLVLSVDFGFSNQFTCGFWRIDPDGRLWLTHEISKSQVLVEDHARHIKKILEDEGLPTPEAVICDHDAEDRATLTRHLGLPTVAAKKAVSRGVQITQARIRKAGDGKPRLYVYRHALIGRDTVAEERKIPRGTIAEVNSYVWETVRGSDGIPKESPRKQHDHSMDQMRYACAYLDWNEASKLGNPAKADTQQPRQGSTWSRPVGR